MLVRKLTILILCLALLLALAGFTYRADADSVPVPVKMTVSAGDITITREDADAIRELFDLYWTLRSRAVVTETEIVMPPEAAPRVVTFFETADAAGFGLRTWDGGPILFFGEEDQAPDTTLILTPAAEDSDALALSRSLDAILNPEPVPDEELPVEEPVPDQELPVEEPVPDEELPVEEPVPDEELPVEEPVPDEELPVEEPDPDQELPVEEPVPDEEPPLPTPLPSALTAPADASSQEPSEEPDAVAEAPSEEPSGEMSGEPSMEPETSADLGSFGLSGAAFVSQSGREDGAPPLWAGETEHTGAEITRYYDLDGRSLELSWQRWWADGTRTESVTSEEFENARAFYRDSMPGFVEGLTVNGGDAFCYDLSGDVTLLWYDSGRDLIFRLTAYSMGAGFTEGDLSDGGASSWELTALAAGVTEG